MLTHYHLLPSWILHAVLYIDLVYFYPIDIGLTPNGSPHSA